MNIAAALRSAKSALDRPGQEANSALLDAQLLLAHILGRPREYLLAHSDDELDQAQQQGFEGLLSRRAAGEPLAYLTGRREFWTFDLEVSPAVLIPRPETECLVEAALDLVASGALTAPETGDDVAEQLIIADLGTGSGAIALAMAHELPQAAVIGVDLSRPALTIATANAVRLGLPVRLVQSNWADALADRSLHMLLANPPYVAADDAHLQQSGLPFEPQQALVAELAGTADLRRIAEQASNKLRPGGWLLMEHGHDQQASILAMLRELGFESAAGKQDLAGIDRLVVARWPA